MINSQIFRKKIILLLFLVIIRACVHDKMVENATFHYYDDIRQSNTLKFRRLLQDLSSFTILDNSVVSSTNTSSTLTASSSISTMSIDSSISSSIGYTRDKIRIFADYSQLTTGDIASINVIKRVVNISANFYYNTLKVDRLNRLYFPSKVPLNCSVLSVPYQYVQSGVIADLGILVGNQDNSQTYVAKSLSCTILKSNNRPVWGVIIFNNRNLGYGQIQFQKIVSVAVHQMTHILGFSSALFPLYPSGNPFVIVNDVQYVTSPKILKQAIAYFNCSNPIGIPLQDQDIAVNSSHFERKVLGNEFMIAISKKQAFISRFTLALLDSSGWYDVNYTFAQPTGWGKNKSCTFLNIDNCNSAQFCPRAASSTSLEINCDWDGTAYGSCTTDPFAGTCNIVNYYTNTICLDENYEFTSLTINLKAKQKGGYNSKCYNSTLRTTGLATSIINFRCYVTICSATGTLYVKVDSYILLCRSQGQQIQAPVGMEGSLRCPSFNRYCVDNKKPCAYHCNKNGICLNGMCLCTGSTILTSTCIDQSNLTTSIGATGGLTKSIIIDNDDFLTLTNSNIKSKLSFPITLSKSQRDSNINSRINIIYTKRGINTKCIKGTFFDKYFSQCVKCIQRFKCQSCTEVGCDNIEEYKRNFLTKIRN